MDKKIKKQLKKHLTGVTLFFAILFLTIGVAVGYFAFNILNSAKDSTTTIELKGAEVITLNKGQIYEELGATFIIDGVDYQNEVVINGAVKTDMEGTYVVTYTLKNETYNIVLKRIVNVGGDSNGN